MIAFRRSSLAPLAWALLLPACGGGGYGSPTTPTTMPAPQRSLVTQGSQAGIPPFSNDGAFYAVVVQFTGAAATLEGIVDWTFATSPVALGWGRGNCLQNPNCELIVQNTTTAKPKTVTATGQQPGTYSLVVINAGSVDEAISYQVFLTR